MDRHYAECRDLFIVTLNVVMLNVVAPLTELFKKKLISEKAVLFNFFQFPHLVLKSGFDSRPWGFTMDDLKIMLKIKKLSKLRLVC